ncbi:MAG: hypothetical protein JEZ07_13005 [Phycisphaerae bacterium]|nr:hypothetical protein [Phycisphaerae bacterium]
MPQNWLNNGPSSGEGGLFRLGLPDGFRSRLTQKFQGEKLSVYYICRIDQIHFKMYAAIDQFGSYHAADLKKLAPTEEELIQAIKWAKTHDPSDGFHMAIKIFLKEFGYEQLAERI